MCSQLGYDGDECDDDHHRTHHHHHPHRGYGGLRKRNGIDEGGARRSSPAFLSHSARFRSVPRPACARARRSAAPAAACRLRRSPRARGSIAARVRGT
eukprot:scaffold5066_cov403-Prasinococcus_capsulatus_cf.AAC.1